MPPKLKSQRKPLASQTAKQDPCCVCLQKFNVKDEILFCAGSCQGYLHRYCASVSEPAFKELSADDADPFLCYCCYRAKKEDQIEALLSTVEVLKAEIQSLKAASCPAVPTTESYSAAAQRDLSSSATTTDPGQAVKNTPLQSRLSEKSPNVLVSSERKFNIVLYGVDECPSGLSKSSRFESDLSNAVKVLSSINKAIEPNSVKDCYRLGKFSPSNSRPRPILVKFIRISDATSILSKRSSLSRPHVVKPDMPREQRERESVLLRERWHLIQSGVHRSNIKINDNRLFVGKKLHGSVVDNKFHLVQNEQCTQHKQCETDHSDNSTPTTATAQSCRNVKGTVNPGSAIVQESTPATNTTVIHSPDPNAIVDPPVSPPSTTTTPPNNS